MRLVNIRTAKAIATAFPPIGTAVEADKAEFEAFKKSPMGRTIRTR